MKKLFVILISLFFIQSVYSQDIEMGYTTTDIGGEFQWYPAGTITGLHIAFNSKLHNSFHFRVGYNKTDNKSSGTNNEEKGGGWGGTFGYRYYFKPFPHKFFIGARTDLWGMTIDWKQGTQSGTTKTLTLQPTFEMGYTFFVNDQMFITPSFANGAKINLKTDGQDVSQGFVTLLGISLGVRF